MMKNAIFTGSQTGSKIIDTSSIRDFFTYQNVTEHAEEKTFIK